MYPVLFRIGTFEVTSFGALVAIGALVGLWLLGRELRRRGLPENASDAGIAGIAGGMVGAKLLWVLEHFGEDPITGLLFSRGGLSWFGGFAGGIAAGLILLKRRRLPIMTVLAAAAPALAIGHALGRVGCFLVGDDYGRPSTLPWAVAFPQGLPPTDVPVHPTQLYEAALLVPIALIVMRLARKGRSDRVVFGAYLVMAGAVRILVELFRINRAVLGPLTVAEIAAGCAVVIGLVFIASPTTSRSGSSRAKV
jgi:phosphatidylglycerol---prolipoprotein diacylglyceryl transferase